MNKTLNKLLENKEISKRLWNVIGRNFSDSRLFLAKFENKRGNIANFITLEDIAECITKDSIHNFRGIGRKAAKEIVDLLDKYEVKHNL